MSLELVIGAGGGLGQALVRQGMVLPQTRVIAISRTTPAPFTHPDLTWLSCDYSPAAMAAVAEQLRPSSAQVTRVTLCNGRLHDHELSPEKALEQVCESSLSRLMHSNTIVPMLWLTHLIPLLRDNPRVVVTVLSARVGSIGDNQLGGWYGYRASKAALNQLLQCCAIESARRAKGVKLVAYHPGTVDTPLSQPFQRRLRPGQLHSPELAARHLRQVTDDLVPDGTLSYLDWRGEPIPW
ncbi:SDR family NAD(P)-dependent oxidoreductase [Ferrimonas sediminicola]|uniref:SDR family NAD(P)-dependent oxidoreductase n=1 Tax=Ferrimonas sediminicola TaxID=2569538 RepID=UPI00197AB667|nr:SDR family NAD(P)-dependent oxidoreductase [Ferrimonas sediminicola]